MELVRSSTFKLSFQTAATLDLSARCLGASSIVFPSSFADVATTQTTQTTQVKIFVTGELKDIDLSPLQAIKEHTFTRSTEAISGLWV